MAENVTAFTASDFGRNDPANGKGSDHAWGSHHLVAGGAVRGNAMYRTFPSLIVDGPDDVGKGASIPSVSVDQYAATMATWFGVGPADLSAVFPNLSRFPTGNLGFIACPGMLEAGGEREMSFKISPTDRSSAGAALQAF